MRSIHPAPSDDVLLAFIKAHQPVATKTIFTSPICTGVRWTVLRSRMARLHTQGSIYVTGHANRAVWSINPHQLPGVALAPKKPTPAACALGPVTQSARYNIFTAPAYVPPRMGTARAGALDFAKCASHGTRC